VHADARLHCLGNTFLHFKEGAHGSMRRSHSFAGYVSHSQRDVEVSLSSVTTPSSSGAKQHDERKRQESGDSIETFDALGSQFEPSESSNGSISSEDASEYQSQGISMDLGRVDEPGLVPSPAEAAGRQRRMLTQHHARPHAIYTMMIRNLPRRITQIDLKREIDSTGFQDSYDFIYMPSIIAAKQGKGYAFVNFVKPQVAVSFAQAWHGSRRFKMGRKANLDVSAASTQGREANIIKWMKSKTSRIANPAFRPIIFDEVSIPQMTLQATVEEHNMYAGGRSMHHEPAPQSVQLAYLCTSPTHRVSPAAALTTVHAIPWNHGGVRFCSR